MKCIATTMGNITFFVEKSVFPSKSRAHFNVPCVFIECSVEVFLLQTQSLLNLGMLMIGILLRISSRCS